MRQLSAGTYAGCLPDCLRGHPQTLWTWFRPVAFFYVSYFTFLEIFAQACAPVTAAGSRLTPPPQVSEAVNRIFSLKIQKMPKIANIFVSSNYTLNTHFDFLSC